MIQNLSLVRLFYFHQSFNIEIWKLPRYGRVLCIYFLFFLFSLYKFKKEHGHKEDIMCIAKSESNFLATSSYDGEIIVWNMVSGHIFCKLKSPKPSNYNDENRNII